MVYTALFPGHQTELVATSTADLGSARTDSKYVRNAARENPILTPQLRRDHRRGPAWKTLRGPASSMKPFFVGPADSLENAEGWAHVMDRRKCLAVAISSFGETTNDRIHITADGSVTLERRYPENSDIHFNGPKRFHFWIHFGHFSPQKGAATSPQAMQNPVAVDVFHGATSLI